MTDREVRSLSRRELLLKLSQENDQLRSKLSCVQTELADRRVPIDLEKYGSVYGPLTSMKK